MKARTYARRALAALGGTAVAMAALATTARPAAGQSIEESIRQLARENAQLYTHPVSAGIGAGMNSGWFHTARVKEPLHVDVGIKVMGALVPEEDEAFEPVLPEDVTVDIPGVGTRFFARPYGTGAGLSTPTAVGDGAGISVPPQNALRDTLLNYGLDPDDPAYALPFPDGFDIPAVPMAALQGTVGLVLGTEATLRWIPSVKINDEVGQLEAFGVGLKHSVSQWFPATFPLDVAVAGGIQSFDVGTYLNADSRHASVIVSKDLAVLTLFASGGVEEADVEVEYTLENPNLPGVGTVISFEDQGENTSRLTVGFNLDLLVLQLNAAYSLADYSVASASAGFTF